MAAPSADGNKNPGAGANCPGVGGVDRMSMSDYQTLSFTMSALRTRYKDTLTGTRINCMDEALSWILLLHHSGPARVLQNIVQ